MSSVLARTFIPGGPDLPANVLQISHDAGVAWVNRPVSGNSRGVLAGPDTITPAEVVAVLGDAGGRIVLAIASIYWDRCVLACQDTLLYTSLDDGRSWQYVTPAAPLHLSRDSQFLSATEWILVSVDGLTFTSTVDGGAHWRTTSRSSPFVGELHLAGHRVGDLGLRTRGLVPERLRVRSDGQQVNPPDGPDPDD